MLVLTLALRRKPCQSWPQFFFFSATVCKGAKADVVFVIDGSWSIGEESFLKMVKFIFSMIGAFDVIGPSGMQVCDSVK